MRVLSTVRHISFSGSFCEAGLKKLATALSDIVSKDAERHLSIILVVVDSILRFTGGGDMERAGGGADLFMA